MKKRFRYVVASIVLTSTLGLTACSTDDAHETTQEATNQGHAHNHSHNHSHNHGEFDETKVKDRSLTDWDGQWQSGYPYVQDGTLDEVWVHKAESKGDKTSEEYKEYYLTGYKTDVTKLNIVANGSSEGSVEFVRDSGKQIATYVYDGYGFYKNDEGETSAARFIFVKKSGDAQAPTFIVFSDHNIEPTDDVEHFHIYWGEDREALVQERVNWPTYFPASWGGEEIKKNLIRGH